ncbi:MAG: GNAT family N-acetyltransferase [Halobacteriales archaeon]|nr:GNAT family N-acetyltransferase [Halobacteriales archaeon]
MEVRPATDGELPAAMTAFDGGGLAVAAERVRAGIGDGRVLAAVEADRLLGALLLEPHTAPDTAEIEAVAVRPGRRGQGIGTALVAAAAERHERLVAGFDPRVEPFWASLGFEIEPGDGADRLIGRLEGTPERG